MHNYCIFFLVLFLTSCHVGEEYSFTPLYSDKDLQDSLNIKSTDVDSIPKNWYKIFNDDDLNTLLTHVSDGNFSIQQGIARLRQSRLQLAIQSKQMYPILSFAGDYDYTKTNTHRNAFQEANFFKTGFDVSWEIDIWGRGKYITDYYYGLMKNAEYSLLNIKTSITAELIANYINLRKEQEKLRITEKNLILQTDILQTIKDKYSAGIVDNLTLNQAEYVVENTKSQIPLLLSQIEIYKNSIATLLGVLPNNLPINLDKFKNNIIAKPFKYSVKELYNLPLGVLRSRPDIMAAETQVYAQNSAINQAITDLYPSLNLSASFSYLSFSGKRLFNNDNQIYSYMPSVSLPIWQWNQLTNNIELQKAIKEEYILAYNEALLTALSELKNALVSTENANKTTSHKKKSFLKMQNILSLTQKKYKNGLTDFTDVATAEQNLLQAQQDFIESNAQILLYLTAFYKATGGGYNIYH